MTAQQHPTNGDGQTSPTMPSGQILTGKQEHYLKRELIARQVQGEIAELNSPTALRRFGAPFKSEFGEVAPVDSELPILRYIFVHHVRNFPFLDQAREKEFWQDKLQVFLESFAKKNVSSSEDRLEETKRRKLARKCEKLVELMMVSGIPTASGYEERIQFSEMEVVDRGANEKGLLVNMPEGNAIHGWDVNVAGVRVVSKRRTVRHHQHAEFILRVRREGKPDIFVARRYGDFSKLHKRLRTEFPGKPLPLLPRKNKASTSSSWFSSVDDETSSISSMSTQSSPEEAQSNQNLAPGDHRVHRSLSRSSMRSSFGMSSNKSPRTSGEIRQDTILFREEQRVSLRAFLRTLLQNKRVAESKSMEEFLTAEPTTLSDEETADMERRKEADGVRITEQKRFYEIARQRAAELDVYMENFRRDIVESNGLTKLFAEIKEKQTVEDLSPQYQKFAEWLRIEIAATLYHLFLAEDNSPELFAQFKRIHSLVPYTLMKNVIRIANPAAVMSGVLDLFLAQPFGSRSLLQRIFSMTLNDGIKAFQKTIDGLAEKVDDPVVCQKMKAFIDADDELKDAIRAEAVADDVDVIVAILRSDLLPQELTSEQFGKVFNAYVAWNFAVDNVDVEMQEGAHWFAQLKQLLKLYTRQRDKAMMLSIVEEPVTLQLFRDLFTIFYEPLVRVYKSANVYSSITDFAHFADDAIGVIEKCQRQDVSADPNQTVQAFIDLCERHQASFYKFVHEVHLHDNGLFGALMGWIEDILEFLRQGPQGGRLDMNALIHGARDAGEVDEHKALEEINALIQWHEDRKRWHLSKTRQKMAADGTGNEALPTFKSSDFGLDEADLEDLAISDDAASESSDSLEEEDDTDPITAERRRRVKKQDQLRRSAGEPVKPEIKEILKLREPFTMMVSGDTGSCEHDFSFQRYQGGTFSTLVRSPAGPVRPGRSLALQLSAEADARRQATDKEPWLYTCQMPQSKQCNFFLWESDAKAREKHAVLTNSFSERASAAIPPPPTPKTPTQTYFGPSGAYGGLLTPQTDRPRYNHASPLAGARMETPSKSAKARMMSEDTDEEWNDDAAGVLESWVDQSAPPRQPDFKAAAAPAAQLSPRKTPRTEGTTSPGKPKRNDVDDADPPSSVATSVATRSPWSFSSSSSFGERTGQMTAPPPASAEVCLTPTPSKYRNVLATTDDLRADPSDLALRVLKILNSHDAVVPRKAEEEVMNALNQFELKMKGISRGREISRIALKKKDDQIARLNEKIAALEQFLHQPSFMESPTTTQPDNHLPPMFRPPINRAMRVLDRSFFQKTVPLSAATVFRSTDISKARGELQRNRDLLAMPRLSSIREVRGEDDVVRKCLLLREGVKHDDATTWSSKIKELVEKEVIKVQGYDLKLEYDYWNYADIIACILPEDLLVEIPQGFTQVGHVLHINLREQFVPYRFMIAEILKDKNPTIRTVIRKTEDVGAHSEFRTFPFEHLAGDKDMNVIQHEQNCEFRFDYSRVYWNSRLETEHRRLVDKFRPGEIVCDVMAGVGPFAVPAGKKKIFVWANDLNPHGWEVMQDAVKRNKVGQFVTPFNKDGRAFIPWAAKTLLESDPVTVTIQPRQRREKKGAKDAKPQDKPESQAPSEPAEVFHRPTVFDHYVMNLPATAIEFLDAFPGIYAGKESLFAPHTEQRLPMVHVYCFSGHSEDERVDHIDICQRVSERIGYTITPDDCVGGSGNAEIELSIHNVRLVSPNKQMFCASFRLPREVAFRV
ncbi:hypothetical protein BDW42DRAFT_184888 [Aspergillus taichungensis]|uniref:tRNA (guanine(37)-N1)-methyltransferase n=1 Tax=Aspergillus taichungensis TaxID=482145 RepID=A0A2J5HXT5_9EURO|nr:hypothetical protein BDW42DRAFT_184888 [Aspergillus taichungensis]